MQAQAYVLKEKGAPFELQQVTVSISSYTLAELRPAETALSERHQRAAECYNVSRTITDLYISFALRLALGTSKQ